MAHSSPTCAASDGKFRLAGKVAGIDACQLVSDCDQVIVGSALSCDLVVTDPLVPRKAFRLVRQRDHFESEQDCRTYWLLETFPGARVYVNDRLVNRGRVTLGDTISLGCHKLQFTVANSDARNWESNTKIDDVCEQLIHNDELPPGYLESCPSWANRRRTQIAVFWTGVLVLVLGIASFFAPHQEKFIQMQPPMEVVVLSEVPPDADASELPPQGRRKSSPQLPGVRSLADVKRQTIGQPDETVAAAADVLPDQAPAVSAMEARTVETATPAQLAQPAAPQFEHPEVSQSSLLPAVEIAHDDNPAAEVSRTYDKLQPTGQGQSRRLSVTEASDPIMQKELGNSGFKIVSNSFDNAKIAMATGMSQSTGPITRRLAKPAEVKLASNHGEEVAALERYQPSPLRFEQQGDIQIPIARLPGNLNPTGIDDPRAADTGKSTGTVVLDGEVSDSEIAFSWKSGQFHSHAPGSPPPVANPATYCYVGKTEKAGRQYLYILFTCMDPNVDQLVLNNGNGTPQLSRDDGVEIFISTDMDYHHYRQMIVNARGNWWSSEVQNQGGGKYTLGPSWNAQPELKTTINKQAGRWTCKILVPFDQLGGVPAKGTSWGVNFCRNFRGQDADDSHLQSWFAVYDKARNFHNSERFGRFDW